MGEDSSWDRGDGAGVAGASLFVVTVYLLYSGEFRLAVLTSLFITTITITYYSVTSNE